MQPEQLFDTLFGIILLLVGGIVKVLWDAVKTLQKDMKSIEVAMPTHYVAKDEFRISSTPRWINELAPPKRMRPLLR
jgi:hypothetical protein